MTGIRAKRRCLAAGHWPCAASIGGAWAAGDAEVHIARQHWTLRGHARPLRRSASCSAASRSMSRFARAATASSGCISATWCSRADRSSRRRPSSRSPATTTKSTTFPTRRARSASARPCWPMPSPAPFPNDQAARYATNGALPPDLSLIAKARGVEAGTPFYRLPDAMLRDMLSGYQEGGADYIYAYLHGLLGAAGRHEDGRVHELQQSVPRPPDGHDQSVHRAATASSSTTTARRPPSTTTPATWWRSWLGGRPDAGGAQAHGPAGDALPAHHRRAARLRQAPHLARGALRAIAANRAGAGTSNRSPPRAGRGVGQVIPSSQSMTRGSGRSGLRIPRPATSC